MGRWGGSQSQTKLRRGLRRASGVNREAWEWSRCLGGHRAITGEGGGGLSHPEGRISRGERRKAQGQDALGPGHTADPGETSQVMGRFSRTMVNAQDNHRHGLGHLSPVPGPWLGPGGASSLPTTSLLSERRHAGQRQLSPKGRHRPATRGKGAWGNVSSWGSESGPPGQDAVRRRAVRPQLWAPKRGAGSTGHGLRALMQPPVAAGFRRFPEVSGSRDGCHRPFAAHRAGGPTSLRGGAGGSRSGSRPPTSGLRGPWPGRGRPVGG